MCLVIPSQPQTNPPTPHNDTTRLDISLWEARGHSGDFRDASLVGGAFSSFLKRQQLAAARCSVLGMKEGRVCNDGTRHRLPTLFANKGGDGGKVVAPTSLRDLVDCPQ